MCYLDFSASVRTFMQEVKKVHRKSEEKPYVIPISLEVATHSDPPQLLTKAPALTRGEQD
jgi:hypothetical protein